MVGLGLLGGALAERFLAVGLRVVGHDVDPNRLDALRSLGGMPAESAGEVARAGRIVFSLPNSRVVSEVLTALRPHLAKGTIVVDTTTGDPEEMESFGQTLAECGVAYLDATVGGSSAQVREKDAIVMVGGATQAVSTCGDLFDAFARQTFHTGPSGSGARMKLVVNLVLGLNRAVLAEGLSFARALGMDATEALAVLKAGPTWSRVMDTKGRKMLDEDFEPQARLAQHRKDVELMLAAAARTGAEVPFSELHVELLRKLEIAGYGDDDNSAIIKAFEGPTTPRNPSS